MEAPGKGEVECWGGAESLDSALDDITELARQCRFRNCSHTGEDGCAIQAALESRALDAGRWQSYEKLRAEIAWQERKVDVTAALAEKQRWKKVHKAMRAHKIRW